MKVLLNVRGVCCLRPGVRASPKTSRSAPIIDRFLEHARIFYFRNGGHEEVYLSSADWMRRNLMKRLEILFPVGEPNLRRRLIDVLEHLFCRQREGAAAAARRHLRAGGARGPRVRAQAIFLSERG